MILHVLQVKVWTKSLRLRPPLLYLPTKAMVTGLEASACAVVHVPIHMTCSASAFACLFYVRRRFYLCTCFLHGLSTCQKHGQTFYHVLPTAVFNICIYLHVRPGKYVIQRPAFTLSSTLKISNRH